MKDQDNSGLPKPPIKPKKPVKPQEPTKKLRAQCHILNICDPHSHDALVSLETLLNLREKINAPDKDIKIAISTGISDDDLTGDYPIVDSVYFQWYESGEDPLYESKYKKYQENLKKYKKQLQAYKRAGAVYSYQYNEYNLQILKAEKAKLEEQIAVAEILNKEKPQDL